MKPYGSLFWERLDRYPPLLCRLLARVPRGRVLETDEIASRSGLTPIQVLTISSQLDWRGIDLPTARAFMVGCNTDLSNRQHCRRIWMYLKAQPKKPSSRFVHLRRSPNWTTYYLPLLEQFVQHHLRNQKHEHRLSRP